MRLVLAMVGMLSIVGVALAQETPKPTAPKGVRGKIVKVDGTNVVVKQWARGGEGKEITVATDDKTKVTLDGKEAKLAELKADMFVTVTPAEGTATEIVATTKMTRPGGGRRGGGAAKPDAPKTE